ncbi:hypothetical protein Cgig2_028459 [Carnegiea gigantea]|uniref:Uncharacterized protein n=1 Tax=Carnegiea gigantea TaxID=171969 RepID=A0A9Q1K932_9CARY|nr:hypothetical protein Cgig2_028459 [Carnegiea gigantea]
MASNKPSNTSLPHANRPKVPTGSSNKRSASDESFMRRNLKRPVVESSQLGDDIEEQDAIFRPWRSLSNSQDNINEEYDVGSMFDLEKNQVKTKKSKNKAIDQFMYEELRSLRSVIIFGHVDIEKQTVAEASISCINSCHVMTVKLDLKGETITFGDV